MIIRTQQGGHMIDMKQLLIIAALLITSCNLCLAVESYSVRMVKSELTRNPDPRTIDFNDQLKWNYTHGLLLQSMMLTAEKHPEIETSVDLYVRQYLDSIISTDGKIRKYSKDKYSLDQINAGKMLIMAYEKYRQPQYKIALDSLYSQLLSQPRVSEGGFWHKKGYPSQMWLDGIYMEAPFYCEYAVRYLTGKAQEDALNDVVTQIATIARHTYDPQTGLYRHAWDESKSQPWCNPSNGQSPHVWGRALGWYCMAMVDVLTFLPESHPGRETILNILQPLCKNLCSIQDKDYKAWYQVMDIGQRDGNYLETSCTAMFAYTLIKGAQNGWLPMEYLRPGVDAYDSLNDNFVTDGPENTITLTRICGVAGLGGNPYRSGTYEYYINEIIRDNDPKGVGPYIMTSLLLGR